MPDLVEPMLAGSGELPGTRGWTVEFAWEGLRVVAYLAAQRVRLRSSTGRSIEKAFPDLEAALRRVAPRGGLVLDGTLVAQGPTGTPRRRVLQSRSGTSRPSDVLMRRVPVAFLVADVLWHDGRSTQELPYRRRRALGEALQLDDPAVWLTPVFPATELGPVMHAADQHGVDALYARQLDAPYRAGRRSKHFLRLPVRRVRQVVVGGFSPADPRRPESAIGALLLGVPEGAGLRYVGRAGLRDAEDRRAVARDLTRLRQARTPFTAALPPEIAEHAVWMAPRLVGAVEYADRLPDGRLRLPTWRGLVPDAEVDPSRFVEVVAPQDDPAPPREPAAPAAPAAPPAPVPPGVERRRLEQHFFYNSLNTIASVIRTDPARARELLLGFADLNRAAERPADVSTLEHEMAAVRAYLQLEQARFGKRLRVDVSDGTDTDPGLREATVAPLALLDAVRATVQERIEPRREGGTLVVRVGPDGCTVAVDGDAPHVRVPLGLR